MTGIESYLWGRACLPTSPSTTGIQRMAAILGLAASSFHRLLLPPPPLLTLSLSLSSTSTLLHMCESPSHEWRLFLSTFRAKRSLSLSLRIPHDANVSLHDPSSRHPSPRARISILPSPGGYEIRVIFRSDITTNRYLSSRCLLVS